MLGERLVPHGDDPLPWEALDAIDGVYFTGGDAATRSAPPAARASSSPRPAPTARCVESGVRLDVLVHSGNDPGEAVQPEELDPPPR